MRPLSIFTFLIFLLISFLLFTQTSLGDNLTNTTQAKAKPKPKPKPKPAPKRDMKLGVAMKGLGGAPAGDNKRGYETYVDSMDRVLVSIQWSKVQSTCEMINNKEYDWSIIDRTMDLIQSHNGTVVAAIQAGPECTYMKGGVNPQTKYIDDWARFAKLLVYRYGPNGIYQSTPLRQVEVGNEPNLHEWAGSPRLYTTTFLRVQKEIRKVNKTIPVITGGIGFCCDPVADMKDFLKNKQFRKQAKYFGMHPYGLNPSKALKLLRQVRSILPKGAKMLVTEHGWSTCPAPNPSLYNGKCQNKNTQARFMKELITKLRKDRYINLDAYYWFTVQDAAHLDVLAACPTQPKYSYGMYEWYGEAKPSLYVWEELTQTDLPDNIGARTGPSQICP